MGGAARASVRRESGARRSRAALRARARRARHVRAHDRCVSLTRARCVLGHILRPRAPEREELTIIARPHARSAVSCARVAVLTPAWPGRVCACARCAAPAAATSRGVSCTPREPPRCVRLLRARHAAPRRCSATAAASSAATARHTQRPGAAPPIFFVQPAIVVVPLHLTRAASPPVQARLRRQLPRLDACALVAHAPCLLIQNCSAGAAEVAAGKSVRAAAGDEAWLAHALPNLDQSARTWRRIKRRTAGAQ